MKNYLKRIVRPPVRTLFRLAVAVGLTIQMTPEIAQPQAHTVLKNFRVARKALGLPRRGLRVPGPEGGTITTSLLALTVQLPTPIVLSANGTFSSNGFGFNLSGTAGKTVVIEASTNLTSWTPLRTNLLLSGAWAFNDRASTSNFALRFYRARLAASGSTVLPDGTLVIELPRVTARYAGFDEEYAVALGRILHAGLNVYEAYGFNMPQTASLDARIDPNGTRLWTDGSWQVFLRLKSKELLAPASRTGVFNIYGMCHELGHIAMYRRLSNLMGLPQGVAEGWADYAGKVVVTEVAGRLGQSIWPEYYDVAAVEGIGRLRRDAAQATPWDQLNPTLRACLVFYRIETEYGRDRVMAAMTAALAEWPSGKALMPLMLEKLRAITGNPAAADWVPQSVIE